MNVTTLEDVFLEAIERFTYPNAQPTGYSQGDFDGSDSGEVEYSEEFTFDAGTICDMHIDGGGWIDCRREDGHTSISGLFTLVREGDWQKGRILPEGEYLQGWYDLEKKVWAFSVDMV